VKKQNSEDTQMTEEVY